MTYRDPSPFGWDKEHDRPFLRLETEKALEVGIEIRAFGADDCMADTLFAVFAGDERLLTRRPEPLLVKYVEDIAESAGLTLIVEGHPSQGIELTESQQETMRDVAAKLKDGLKPSDSIIQ